MKAQEQASSLLQYHPRAHLTGNGVFSARNKVTEKEHLFKLPEPDTTRCCGRKSQLTVMLQASKLKSLVVGQDHPTVISFDMALYEKAVQLLDARPNLKKEILPRLGELHAVMAALRALGTSIENSGINDAWTEADI